MIDLTHSRIRHTCHCSSPLSTLSTLIPLSPLRPLIPLITTMDDPKESDDPKVFANPKVISNEGTHVIIQKSTVPRPSSMVLLTFRFTRKLNPFIHLWSSFSKGGLRWYWFQLELWSSLKSGIWFKKGAKVTDAKQQIKQNFVESQ